VKVIAQRNLPFRPPVIATAVAALVLDRLDAPDLAWGILGTLYALIWIAWVTYRVNREEVDLFPSDGKVTRGTARDAAVD
jgi:hypothetical protein